MDKEHLAHINHVVCRKKGLSLIIVFLLTSCSNRIEVITENLDKDKIVIFAQVPYIISSKTMVYSNGEKVISPPNMPNEKIVYWYVLYNDTFLCQFAQNKKNWKNKYKCKFHLYLEADQIYCNYEFEEKGKREKGVKLFTPLKE